MVMKICIACYCGQGKVSIPVYLAIKKELCNLQVLIAYLKWRQMREIYLVSVLRRILFLLKTDFIDTTF